jgi:hypothetical protein
MQSRSLLLLSVLALSTAGHAQIYTETFDGPGLPAGWQVRSGTWAIVGGQATVTAGATSYMTLPAIKLLNCVVEADVYWGGQAVQLGGVAGRHGGTATEDCVMMKVQSNSTAPLGFDTLWNYERPGGVVAQTGISPVMTKTRIRMLIVGNQGWLQLDSTQDGIYDMTVGPKAYTGHTTAGEVGIVGFRSGAVSATIDNFAVYDAVLMESTGATPKIGTTYNMTLTTQQTTAMPFICAMSLSNGGTVNGNLGGLPIGGGRFIPLGADPLFDASLAAGGAIGLTGITDAAGVGNPKLVIPNMPALIGIGIHVAGITAGGPGGIGNISNNHYVVFQP